MFQRSLFVALVVGLATVVVQNVAAQSASLVLSEISLDVTEASSASYTVKLATQPTADVTVSIGGTSGTDLSLNRTSLTFTTSNWDTAQSVTVSAAQDSDATHDSATLTHTASGGGYGTVSADLAVTVTDTTRMRLVAVVERVPEGESKPIRAMLPMPLDDDVTITVTVTPNGGRADEYELSANTTLTIAAGETESTGEVIFTSLDDFTYTGIRYFNATLTADHSRVDADTESFSVVDDDRTIIGWRVTPSTIFENGGEATLRADKHRLHEGVVKMTVSLEPSGRAMLSSTTLTFQPGAIYATETLTITAVDNAADEPDQTITISATVTEGRGVRTPTPLELTIEDDDDMSLKVALVLTPPVVREGLASTVTAVTSGPLDAEATITVSASPSHADTRTDDYVLSANTVLTIPSGGTRSTGTVTIATVDDQLNTASRRRVVTVSGTVTGGGGVANPADQTLTVQEDDLGVSVSLIATPATIKEGEVSTITMRSLQQPMPADVTVTLSEYSNAAELSANPVLMIAKGQTESTGLVTLTAVDDANMSNDVVSVYGDPSPDSTFVRVFYRDVYILDDDVTSARVVVSPVPGEMFEGETSTIIAALSQPLSDDVTVTIGVDEADSNHTATADEYTLSGNRTLTIPAGQTSSTGVVTLTASNDEFYGPLFLRTVVLDIASVTGIDRNQVHKHSDWTILDDENVPRVTLEPTPTSILENGGQSTVTARLNTKVNSDVKVTISAAPVGTTRSGDFTQIGTYLTIPAGAKASTGTVTISAVDDHVDGPDKNLVVTGTVDVVGMEESGRVWYPFPEGLTIRDDDESGLTVSPAALTIDEGDDGTYTVVLNSEPPGTVNVLVSGTAGTDLTLSSSSLTFMPSDWNVEQTVTVTAGQDDDTSNDMELLTHTASRTEYGAFALPVTVIDDEGAALRIRLEVEPKQVMEDAGPTMVAVKAVLTGGVRQSNTMVMVTVEERDEEYLVSPALFELEIAAGETSVDDEFMLTPIDDDEVEEDLLIGITGVNGSDGIPVDGTAVRLLDDEGAALRIRLEVEPKQMMEDAGPTMVAVKAVLTGGVRQSNTMVMVTVEERDEEYLVSPALFELEIAAGETSVDDEFMLTPIDDDEVEADLLIGITGVNRSDGIPVDGTTVRLLDNDGDDDDGDDDDGSNRPPAFDRSYTFDLRENRSGREVPVVLGTVRASDPDGDGIRYSLVVGDRDRFTVSRGGGTVSYIGEGEDFEAGPSQFELQVTANDGQYQAIGRVVVRVVDVAEKPKARNDRVETPEDTPTLIDVLSNDRDPEGDRLRIASVGAAEHGTTAVVSNRVRYAPDLNWHGTDRFTYKVSDPGGLTAKATVRIVVLPVNDPPEAVDDEAETLEDEAAVVDVLANDTDVDGDPLRVVSVGPAGHGATEIASRRVRYSPDANWYGTDRFAYTIADPDGLTATATVAMTVLPVNDAPEAVGVIPDQALEEGGGPVTVDLTPYFTDVDGDVLTYAAASSDETAVTVTVTGATLTLSAVVTGAAAVMVTASDVEGLTATQTFGVQVGDRLVRAVMTDTLAALGRGHLSSARSTIGRHLEMGGSEATRLMVGGQFLSLDAWDRMGGGGLEQSHGLLFRAAQLRQRLSATDLVGTSAESRLGRSGPGLMGGAFGGGWDRLLQGTDVLLSFGGQDERSGPLSEGVGGPRWTVWGQGDLQTFRGAETESEGYDGDLRTGYLGLDARLGEKWLVGAAVARSGGGGDWRVGSSSGHLTTALTVVHPYLRWGGRDTSVWALAGIGLGSAENMRMLTGKRGTSPLRLGLSLVEGRRRLATTGRGLAVDLRGEASWARLRTGDGEETVDGLEAGVRRVRTGVEVTLALDGPGGLQVAPFGAVSTRHDGGAGQTGVGLEVAGGVRMTGGRVRVEAQGRMLALHTATDYQERGVSVTASVGAGQHEPGLTASIRPRWGAPGYGAESLWQDQLQSYTYGAERDDVAVDARVGYGLRLPGGRLLTPFGGYGQMGTGRRMQVGANLGRLGVFGGGLDSPLQVEFVGERYVRPQGRADHRLTLFGIVNIGALRSALGRVRVAASKPDVR